MDGLYLKITQDFAPDPKEARFGGKDSPMAVEKGDIIFDVRKRGDGWMYGKNLNSGKTGKFPESCAAKLTGNNKKGSGSGSPDTETNSDEKPAAKDDKKPAWLQNRTTTPTVRKTPLYPKPFAGSMKQPQEKAKEERKETSGDSGVVEDSVDGNYCNDDEKSAKRDVSKTGNPMKDDKQDPKFVPRSLQTLQKQKPGSEATETEKEPPKAIGRPFRLNLNRSGDSLKSTETKAALRVDTKKKPTSATARDSLRSKPTPNKDFNEDGNYEPVEKSKETKLQLRETLTSSKPKEVSKPAETQLGKINPTENAKNSGEKNHSNVTNKRAAGGAAVNIQENPLLKDEANIYQVPNVVLPPKPARSNDQGCAECNEPHIYDTPMHYKTPPSSPSTKKRGIDETTVEKPKDKNHKSKDGSSTLKPTSSVIRKTKEQMKNRMASYESIDTEGKRSTESIKDAVLAVKETKEKLLAPKRRPKLRILLGMFLGLLLGVFIFLTFFLLAHLHVVTSIVSALIVGFVVATIFGFLDKTRLQCIALLVFPSLFACGGKISLWLLITFFILSGPMCNFIENVRLVTHHRACLMDTEHFADNSSDNPARFVLADKNNRAVVQRLIMYENISHELQEYMNNSLLSSADSLDNLSADNNSFEPICMSSLRRAFNICASEIDNMYSQCTKLNPPNCQFLTPRNACDHLTDSQIRETCKDINNASYHTLSQIEKIIGRFPERMATKDSITDKNNTVVATGEPCDFVHIITLLLPLLVLIVLYEAYSYHKWYLSCNEFDNHYLTLRFKSIEDMRKSSGAADLLVPLKKAELQRFVQPTGCQLAKSEKRSMLKYLMFYFVYLIYALIIIFLDHYFYLVITREEPRSNIPGRCDGTLKRLNESYVIVLSTLLGVLLLIIILQAFILRLRRLIASRFYPRRERKRIAYLYYKLLEERKLFYKSVIENMNNFSEENETLNKLDAVLVLCNNFSWIKAVFEFVGVSVQRCSVCGTGLSRKYLHCDTEDCEVFYCRTCFWDLENKCLGCMSNSKMTSRSSSMSGQSQRRKNDYVKPV
ncbi:DC-STAMP domain-containing protein 2-like [Stylophora pistillata]|uniref:DC-STAMP domain-containing protein 2-like n=1 Tax=Stylophora pistillata TaxID=50429 RepID=UPI000C03C2F4|nr:DC-STAMP domain-containing protein 2-like [Stylophora pistillata]